MKISIATFLYYTRQNPNAFYTVLELCEWCTPQAQQPFGISTNVWLTLPHSASLCNDEDSIRSAATGSERATVRVSSSCPGGRMLRQVGVTTLMTVTSC